jgi:hypothetical protein
MSIQTNWIQMMKIQTRAARLLGLDGTQRKSISGVAKEMNITRFQLLHFLHGSSPQISRGTFEAVCQYLLRHNIVTLDNVFQELFVVEPDSFWPMLSARQQIHFSVGVRWTKVKGFDQQVVADDAVLQSVMVNELMGSAANSDTKTGAQGRHPRQVIDSQLIMSWGARGVTNTEIEREARAFYKRCTRGTINTATICIGSIKSNPACDPFIARAFSNAKPFESEDAVRVPDERHCPFAMIYREDDPHPASCWGGVQLSREDPRTTPGICFAREEGQWDLAVCNKREDAALVYYCFHKSQENLEMVWGGYTGRSTRCLAEMLRDGRADEFWPPAVDTEHLRVGAFIVRFWFRPRRASDSIRVRPHELLTKHEVIPLTEAVITPRLARPRDSAAGRPEMTRVGAHRMEQASRLLKG